MEQILEQKIQEILHFVSEDDRQDVRSMIKNIIGLSKAFGNAFKGMPPKKAPDGPISNNFVENM